MGVLLLRVREGPRVVPRQAPAVEQRGAVPRQALLPLGTRHAHARRHVLIGGTRHLGRHPQDRFNRVAFGFIMNIIVCFICMFLTVDIKLVITVDLAVDHQFKRTI